MNLPNKITTLRILLTPIFLASALYGGKYRFFIAGAIYIISCISDFADGYIARKYNLITNFGKIADPIADKILTTSAFLFLLYEGFCDIWPVIIILFREFTVSSVRTMAAAKGTVIPASMFGKVKTVAEMVFTTTILILAGIYQNKFGTPLTEGGFFKIPFFSELLMWLCAGFTVSSGAIYIKNAAKLIDFKNK